jgi:hypothetical protein
MSKIPDSGLEFEPGKPVILAWFEDPEYYQYDTIEDAARALWSREWSDDWHEPLGIEIVNEDGTGDWIGWRDDPRMDPFVRKFDQEDKLRRHQFAATQMEYRWRVCLRGPQEANTHDAEVADYVEYDDAVKLADQIRLRFGGRVTVNEI